MKNPRIRKFENTIADYRQKIAEREAEIKASGKPPTAADQDAIAIYREGIADTQERLNRAEEAFRADAAAPPIATANGSGLGPASGISLGGDHRAASKPSNGVEWFNRMFPRVSDHSGFGSVDEFLKVVKSERWDERLSAMQVSGQKEGTGAAGGFLVPEEYAVDVLGPSYEKSVCLQRADVRPMTSETKSVAGWDTSSASGGTMFGGFTPAIVGEGESMSATDTLVKGTDAASIAATAGVTNQQLVMEVDPRKLTSGYDCIAATLSDSSQATNFATVTYFIETRYPSETPPSAIVD